MGNRRIPYTISDEERNAFYALKRKINRNRERLENWTDQYKPLGAKHAPIQFRPPKITKNPSSFKSREEYLYYMQGIKEYNLSYKQTFAQNVKDYKGSFIVGLRSSLGDSNPVYERAIQNLINSMSNETFAMYANKKNTGSIGYWYDAKEKEKMIKQIYEEMKEIAEKAGELEKAENQLRKNIRRAELTVKNLIKQGFDGIIIEEYNNRIEDQKSALELLSKDTRNVKAKQKRRNNKLEKARKS